jgi:hypothetical protein
MAVRMTPKVRRGLGHIISLADAAASAGEEELGYAEGDPAGEKAVEDVWAALEWLRARRQKRIRMPTDPNQDEPETDVSTYGRTR